MLGTGKIDMVGVAKLVKERAACRAGGGGGGVGRTLRSLPRKRESEGAEGGWVPAFAGPGERAAPLALLVMSA